MTEQVAASDLQQPGTVPAAAAATTAAPSGATATQKVTIHYGHGVAVPEEMKANAVSSAEPMRELIVETFRGMGVDEAALQQARERTPITEHEYNLAQHKLASLKQDRAWVQRYLNGDMECRRVMGTLSILIGSPIKEAGKP
jgi:hypothetical protein